VNKGEYKAQTCSTPYNERWSFTELRVLCTIAGEWAEPTSQLLGLILVYQNQSKKVEIKVLK